MKRQLVESYKRMQDVEMGLKGQLGGLFEDLVDEYLCQEDIEDFKPFFWQWQLLIDWTSESILIHIASATGHMLRFSIEGLHDDPERIESWVEDKRETLLGSVETISQDWRLELGEQITGLVLTES